MELLKNIYSILTNIVAASNHTKWVSLSNHKFQIQATFINSYPNKYRQELHYYLFSVQLDKCVVVCNILYEVFIPNKTEDLNICVFNMIT